MNNFTIFFLLLANQNAENNTVGSGSSTIQEIDNTAIFYGAIAIIVITLFCFISLVMGDEWDEKIEKLFSKIERGKTKWKN